MKNKRILILLLALLMVSCSQKDTLVKWESSAFEISLNRNGFIETLADRNSGKNYLALIGVSPLLSIQVDKVKYDPLSASYDQEKTILFLEFQKGFRAAIKIESKSTHITFELIEMSQSEDIELIVWGPYPTSIKKIIGETIGVVRGEKYAIGIQALNIKTLGGYPWNENDHLPQTDIFAAGEGFEIDKGRKGALYSVEAAKPTDYGSTLQAYCRNRNKDRVIPNWDHNRYVAPAFKDGGIFGSKIALFGCPVEETLETLGAIERAEGLPHPQIDGQWGKTAPSASAAYVILNFGEADIDRALDITRKAGLRYLYHSDPFETWGHFALKKNYFPRGIESVKLCVEKAQLQGIMLGFHTLSNFITTNDPYVTPVPDKRLARVGSTVLTQDVDAFQSAIHIESPDFFNQFKRNVLQTVRIDDELIRYGGISENAPWTLVDCVRGVFGTAASVHQKGEEISKLADHGYKVFLTDSYLSMEVAKNLAELFNAAGLRQISFDGLEGNHSTGMGNYGEVLFTKTWYDFLDEDIKQHYIADASRSGHFFWHIYTRLNWGEPWYAGFRESQTEYRLRNQQYFSRNLLPGMLGWFRMTAETSIEDIEWMLARSAAFEAGYAFYTDYPSLEANGFSEDILKLLGEWENARMAGAFSEQQKELMLDIQNEFHLETIEKDSWALSRIYSYKFKHEPKDRKPGEPVRSTYVFENPVEEQTMNFILTPVGGAIRSLRMEIDDSRKIEFPFTLQEGQTLKYSRGDKAIIYNSHWTKIQDINIEIKDFLLSNGAHTFSFDCICEGDREAYVKLELRVSASADVLFKK